MQIGGTERSVMLKKIVTISCLSFVFIILMIISGCSYAKDDSILTKIESDMDDISVLVDESPDNSEIVEGVADSNANDYDTDCVVGCKGVVSSETYGEYYTYEVQLIGDDYSWLMIFKLCRHDTVIQTIEKNIDFDLHPEGIRIPVRLVDLNDDGKVDFIIDYGVCGKVYKSECIIWNSEKGIYEILGGYAELCNAVYDSRTGIIYATEDYGTIKDTYKYVVHESSLELIAVLIADYSSGNPRYTEKRIEDSILVVTQDSLTESQADLSDWLYY